MNQFWKDHGTKILGTVITVLSGLAAGSVVLPPPLNTHAQAIAQWAAFLNFVLGAGVIIRGNTNTQAIAEQAKSKVPPAALVMLAMAMLPLLVGCGTLGLTKPTFNEGVYAAYGTADTIATTTDTLLKAGKIKGSVASNIATQDQNLKTAIDLAKSTYATNQADGANQLQTVTTSLNALTTYLTTLGAPAK